MTEPPKDKLFAFVLKEGATRDREEPPLPVIRYALKGNAVRLFLAQRGRCFHCDKDMIFMTFRAQNGRNVNGYSLEHVVPASQMGGKGTNIVLAHGRCNMERGLTKFSLSQMIKRDEIWAIAAKYEQYLIYVLSRSMNIRGKKFDPLWLDWKGGIRD